MDWGTYRITQNERLHDLHLQRFQLHGTQPIMWIFFLGKMFCTPQDSHKVQFRAAVATGQQRPGRRSTRGKYAAAVTGTTAIHECFATELRLVSTQRPAHLTRCCFNSDAAPKRRSGCNSPTVQCERPEIRQRRGRKLRFRPETRPAYVTRDRRFHMERALLAAHSVAAATVSFSWIDTAWGAADFLHNLQPCCVLPDSGYFLQRVRRTGCA